MERLVLIWTLSVHIETIQMCVCVMCSHSFSTEWKFALCLHFFSWLERLHTFRILIIYYSIDSIVSRSHYLFVSIIFFFLLVIVDRRCVKLCTRATKPLTYHFYMFWYIKQIHLIEWNISIVHLLPINKTKLFVFLSLFPIVLMITLELIICSLLLLFIDLSMFET